LASYTNVSDIVKDSFHLAAAISAAKGDNDAGSVLDKAAVTVRPKPLTYDMMSSYIGLRHRQLANRVISRLRLNQNRDDDKKIDGAKQIKMGFARLALTGAMVVAAQENIVHNLLASPKLVAQAQEAAAAGLHTLLRHQLQSCANIVLGESIQAIPLVREMRELRERAWVKFKNTSK